MHSQVQKAQVDVLARRQAHGCQTGELNKAQGSHSLKKKRKDGVGVPAEHLFIVKARMTVRILGGSHISACVYNTCTYVRTCIFPHIHACVLLCMHAHTYVHIHLYELAHTHRFFCEAIQYPPEASLPSV